MGGKAANRAELAKVSRNWARHKNAVRAIFLRNGSAASGSVSRGTLVTVASEKWEGVGE
jgi:hypothetical protein